MLQAVSLWLHETVAGEFLLTMFISMIPVVELRGGVPVTSKKDTDMHGLGISSIRNAVSRYGGTVSVKADNESKEFTLVVMIPS